MPLGYDRPTDSLLRELSAVARRAAAFESAVSANTNSPPEALPLEHLTEIMRVLRSLPHGTGEWARLQLETADARLNEIRIEYFSLADFSDDDPGFMRDVPLDDTLSLLIAAVRTALSAANREAGRREQQAEQIRSTSRTKAEDELLGASGQASETIAVLENAKNTGSSILDPKSLRADILLRRLNDAIGLVRQARVELQWKEVVTAWLRRLSDALAKTPDLIRSAAEVIETAHDVLGPFYEQWRSFQNDIENIVRGNLLIFTKNLRLAADRLEKRRRNESILFVDDEEAACSFAGHALRTAYRDVETAASGIDALVLAKAKKFDVLIADVVMPDMGGLALAATMRKVDREIAVLMVSGYAEQAIQREIKAEGYGFLAKPYTLEALNKAVEQTISKNNKI